MEIQLNTNFSEKFSEASITINAPKLSKEIQNIITYISNIDEIPSQIVASKNNEIYFLDIKNIISFFSKDKYVYAKTEVDTYKVKYKLYEIEELFEKSDFIRISNSCIININKIECFDTSIIGSITVKMKDNTKENVSKRNISRIMKMLNERGNLK